LTSIIPGKIENVPLKDGIFAEEIGGETRYRSGGWEKGKHKPAPVHRTLLTKYFNDANRRISIFEVTHLS
jgi:hypothetical protein